MEKKAEEREHWLEKTIRSFFSSRKRGESTGTPAEMIDRAGQRAFKISTALALIPGPLGMATILPEVAALTRLQINLIYDIAGHYRKEEKVTPELVLLILGSVLGVTAGEAIVREAGSALVLKSVSTRLMRGLSRKIGTRIVDQAAERAIMRWIPMLTAPLFGYFSRALTKKIGREANRFFSEALALAPAGGEAL